MNNKYKIERVRQDDGSHRVVVTAPDGKSNAPSCGDDLLALYKYELSIAKGCDTKAQALLADVIDKKMPVTRLAAIARGDTGVHPAMQC